MVVPSNAGTDAQADAETDGCVPFDISAASTPQFDRLPQWNLYNDKGRVSMKKSAAEFSNIRKEKGQAIHASQFLGHLQVDA